MAMDMKYHGCSCDRETDLLIPTHQTDNQETHISMVAARQAPTFPLHRNGILIRHPWKGWDRIHSAHALKAPIGKKEPKQKPQTDGQPGRHAGRQTESERGREIERF